MRVAIAVSLCSLPLLAPAAFAQAPAAGGHDLSDIPSWAQTLFVAGGGAGLIAILFRWLLVTRMPQLEERLDRAQDKFTVALKEQQTTFESSLDQVTNHCEEEMQGVVSRYEVAIARIEKRFEDTIRLVTRPEAGGIRREDGK